MCVVGGIELERMGATVVFDIDATAMAAGLASGGPFDTVVFNFPLVPRLHDAAAFRKDPCPVTRNRRMLQLFLLNVAPYVRRGTGEVHITSKDVMPYVEWQIPQLMDRVPAERAPMAFARECAFDPAPYAALGYESRKPDNVHHDRVEEFAFTNCKTYVFMLPTACTTSWPVTDPQLKCAVCGITLTGAATMGEHIEGKRHRRRAKVESKWEADMRRRGLID